MLVFLYIIQSAELLQQTDGRAVVVDHDGGGDEHDGHAGEQQTPGLLPAQTDVITFSATLAQTS